MLLEFDSVAFSYPKTPVLRGLSLRVAAGEIVGFLGINGSGKTTTFLLATGVLSPESGSIRLLGHEPRSSRGWCSRVGVVHSGVGHYNRLTVRRNLEFFAGLQGVKPNLENHLTTYGLADVASKTAGQLSQGYRQRLALARATVHSPDLLLLDEPSDGLDPSASDDLHQSVRDFAAKGGGVLLTSHRVEEVESLCHRVVLLSDGAALMEGTPEALAQGVEGGLRQTLRSLRQKRA